MKKYSTYYKECMVVAIIALISSIVLFILNMPMLSAGAFVLSFASWFAGIMAPDHEKYSFLDVKVGDKVKIINAISRQYIINSSNTYPLLITEWIQIYVLTKKEMKIYVLFDDGSSSDTISYYKLK